MPGCHHTTSNIILFRYAQTQKEESDYNTIQADKEIKA